MRPRPIRGRPIRASEVDAVARRAYTAVARPPRGIVTNSGTQILEHAGSIVAQFEITSLRWEAKEIGSGNYWLAASARRIGFLDSYGWGAASSNPRVAIWWPWFGPVASTLKVPVTMRRVTAFLNERGRWELAATFQPIFRVILLSAFDANHWAAAYFAQDDGNPYSDVGVSIYDPFSMFVGAANKPGYATLFRDSTVTRLELLQLLC